MITLTRQEGFISSDKMTSKKFHIIGCGGLGSPLALILAKMGANKISLYDLDTVEEVNINNQLFGLKDLGSYKTEAVKKNICALSAMKEDQIDTYNGDITQQDLQVDSDDIIILALDSNNVRRKVYRKLMDQYFTGLIVDPRMGGLVFSVYTSQGASAIKYRLFTPKDDAVPEDICTAKAIAFNTFGCASVASSIIKKYLNEEIEAPFHVQMDMQNFIITPLTQ